MGIGSVARITCATHLFAEAVRAAALRGSDTRNGAVFRRKRGGVSQHAQAEDSCAVALRSALLRVRDPPHHGRNVFHRGFKRMHIRDGALKSRVSLVLAGVPCADVERPADGLATQAQARA